MGIKLIKSSIEFCGKLKRERQWWWRRRRWPAQHIEQRTKGERVEFVALCFWFALFIFLRCCFIWLLFYRYYAIKLQSTLMPVDIRNYFVWIKKINRLMIFLYFICFFFLLSICPFLSFAINPCAYDFNHDCLIPRNRYIHYHYLDMPIRVGIGMIFIPMLLKYGSFDHFVYLHLSPSITLSTSVYLSVPSIVDRIFPPLNTKSVALFVNFWILQKKATTKFHENKIEILKIKKFIWKPWTVLYTTSKYTRVKKIEIRQKKKLFNNGIILSNSSSGTKYTCHFYTIKLKLKWN